MSTHNPPHRKASGRGVPGKNFIANASTSSRLEGKANGRGPPSVSKPSVASWVPQWSPLYHCFSSPPPNFRQVTSSWLRGGLGGLVTQSPGSTRDKVRC